MFRLLTKARPAIVLGSTAFILRNAPSAWDYLTSTLGPAAVCGNGTEVPCAPAVMPWGGTGKKPVPKYGRTRGEDRWPRCTNHGSYRKSSGAPGRKRWKPIPGTPANAGSGTGRLIHKELNSWTWPCDRAGGYGWRLARRGAVRQAPLTIGAICRALRAPSPQTRRPSPAAAPRAQSLAP